MLMRSLTKEPTNTLPPTARTEFGRWPTAIWLTIFGSGGASVGVALAVGVGVAFAAVPSLPLPFWESAAKTPIAAMRRRPVAINAAGLRLWALRCAVSASG